MHMIKPNCVLIGKGFCEQSISLWQHVKEVAGVLIDTVWNWVSPHQALAKPKGEQNSTIIWVIGGSMIVDEVASGMDRLVPGSVKWAVQEVDRNTFKRKFQSKIELHRMVEWGIVQTKDKVSKMIIKENSGSSHFKQALCKVWVQMWGLPGELREYCRGL
jgi:hypothetical protein